MSRYLLDTNGVSDFIRNRPFVVERVLAAPMASLHVSAMTEGELRFGLSLRPEAKKTAVLVEAFLRRVTILPWTSEATRTYGPLRALLQNRGPTLEALNLLIAAHAMSLGLVLMTADKALQRVEGLAVEDWRER